MAQSPPLLPVDDDARALVRRLLHEARFAALSHLDPATGHPLVSRVGIAAHEGVPIMLMSQLSAHTAALKADQRCSLLVGEPGKGDPLAHPRVTLIGRARKVTDQATRSVLRGTYLARHPKAELYVDFADFAFWQMELERAALNGGFGKAYALDASDLT